ncbi:MAG: RNA polymerase II elongation factor [Peltula sp. TS41687]|nr:MAG: RNA polymerase II elongation factor [Peltula sp. TS41687]
MDSNEINILVKSLNKAAAAKEAPSVLIDILTKLSTGVVPTEELLRMKNTKVGVMVNRHRQNANEEVSRLATDIVTRWKGAVKVKPKKVVAPPKVKTPVPVVTPSVKKIKEKPISPDVKVPLDQRTWQADGVDINRTDNEQRNKCIGLIYNGLAHMSPESPTVCIKHAIDVEQAALDTYGPGLSSAYRAKLRSLYQNLKQEGNPELRIRVLSDEISAAYFVVMSYDELKSEAMRAEERMWRKENMDKAMVAQVEKSVSTSLQCGRCHQKKVSYTQAQTRSADEPMTTFFLLNGTLESE